MTLVSDLRMTNMPCDVRFSVSLALSDFIPPTVARAEKSYRVVSMVNVLPVLSGLVGVDVLSLS